MHTEFQPEDPEVLREMKYDRRDLKMPMVKSYTITITVSCVICFLISIPVYNWVSTPGGTWARVWGSGREPAPPSQNHMPPGTPLLQDNFSTKVDIQELRRSEEERMKTYGWIDQNAGVVRIPIEKAMKMIEKKGVSTGTQVLAVTKGTTIPQNAVGPGTSKPLGQ